MISTSSLNIFTAREKTLFTISRVNCFLWLWIWYFIIFQQWIVAEKENLNNRNIITPQWFQLHISFTIPQKMCMLELFFFSFCTIELKAHSTVCSYSWYQWDNLYIIDWNTRVKISAFLFTFLPSVFLWFWKLYEMSVLYFFFVENPHIKLKKKSFSSLPHIIFKVYVFIVHLRLEYKSFVVLKIKRQKN